MVDALERVTVLLTQEHDFYQTSDYLTRMQAMARSGTTPSGELLDGSAPPSPKKRKSEDGSSSDVSSAECSESSSASVINKHWREKICEWAYQVVDHFNLHREVVSIAMNHLDRYLASYPTPVDKNTFQLLAMTCLYLSIKLNEYKHLLIAGSKSSMDTILQLSRGFFTLKEMEKMEYDILQRLQWHVHPPSPQVFVKHFLFFMSLEDADTHDLAQFMAELSVMDYFFVNYKPSVVAIASIMNAMDRLFPESSGDLNLPIQNEHFDCYSKEVQECRDRLALIYAQANDQGPFDSPRKEAAEQMNRTTSPVSVLAANTSHYNNVGSHDNYSYQSRLSSSTRHPELYHCD